MVFTMCYTVYDVMYYPTQHWDLDMEVWKWTPPDLVCNMLVSKMVFTVCYKLVV